MGHEKILEEIIVENFPKGGKEIATQVQETQRVPNRINPSRNTTRHILFKLMGIKCKEQILKSAREKQQKTHKRLPVKITAAENVYTLTQSTKLMATGSYLSIIMLPGASVRNPARDKVMRKEADIRKACSDFRDPSGNS